MKTVRTRIAPSPTGDPHVGTAYIALFNYAFAKQHGGQFILRIEDTDQVRSTKESEEMIFSALKWLGLNWDEGPDIGGDKGPYRQSERSAIYKEYAMKLVEAGKAYPCFCTKERLDQVREAMKAEKKTAMYDRHCRDIPKDEALKRMQSGEPYVIRLAMPTEGSMTVHDLLRGDITIGCDQLDDQVLIKADGFPTYHLANVVDDHLMEITHVIRAEEWISSLPKHVYLYEAFGWEAPVFCHMPLLRNADKSKISKRKNPVSLNYYRRAGYLPEAILNYLALMGFAMPDEREEFSLQEFTEALNLEKVSLGGPVFDMAKLQWLNGKYIRALDRKELANRLYKEILSPEYLDKILELVQPRFEKLEDFIDYSSFFFVGPMTFNEKMQKKLIGKNKTAKDTAKVLAGLVEEKLDGIMNWCAANLEKACNDYIAEIGWTNKEFFMPLRVAVTGKDATPPLFETMEVLGKEVCRTRLKAAAKLLKEMP